MCIRDRLSPNHQKVSLVLRQSSILIATRVPEQARDLDTVLPEQAALIAVCTFTPGVPLDQSLEFKGLLPIAIAQTTFQQLTGAIDQMALSPSQEQPATSEFQHEDPRYFCVTSTTPLGFVSSLGAASPGDEIRVLMPSQASLAGCIEADASNMDASSPAPSADPNCSDGTQQNSTTIKTETPRTESRKPNRSAFDLLRQAPKAKAVATGEAPGSPGKHQSNANPNLNGDDLPGRDKSSTERAQKRGAGEQLQGTTPKQSKHKVNPFTAMMMKPAKQRASAPELSLIHISEPTRLLSISYAVFCLKKKKKTTHHIE
eukprot:TRINITY_DN45405_c0_g1_i1.p1 TRINITY_DN45405_c0_g1~~TRINITY_DN45405_c0_g1_i1.p1  ORF type:complete len:316 (-),score=72.24 TRINITY_DN45405_c0_g1_i1:82-1029(-)